MLCYNLSVPPKFYCLNRVDETMSGKLNIYRFSYFSFKFKTCNFLIFKVFSKLASEETDFMDDPEDVANIPKFGNSKTPYEDVHEFYAYWMSFSTNKSRYMLFM